MAFNIKNFKSNLLYGGARTNLFEVHMGYPPGLNVDDDGVELNEFSRKLKFLCKSAAIPSTSVGSVSVTFQGREVYTAGTKVFDPLIITVINDEDFYIRRTFEYWIGAINGHSSNTKNSGVNSSPSSYQVDGLVKQFSQTLLGPPHIDRNSITEVGNYQNIDAIPIRVYKFVNMFPISLGSIELGWDNERIEEFTVTFKYDYWAIGPNE